MNVRVEFDPAPIRHIAVQCPKCGKWFRGWDIHKGEFRDLRYNHDIDFAEFECPVCEAEFGGIQHAEKVFIKSVGSAEECYKDCLQKKEIWE